MKDSLCLELSMRSGENVCGKGKGREERAQVVMEDQAKGPPCINVADNIATIADNTNDNIVRSG